MKRCPKCGCETFYATAHVTQGWKMDKYGVFMEMTDDCIEVTHYPDDVDLWCCTGCFYEDRGDAFNVREENNNV